MPTFACIEGADHRDGHVRHHETYRVRVVAADQVSGERQERLIAARRGDPFDELQVSHAALTLRQGAGRLIRTETDRGVIAVLDSRIVTNTRYGPKIIRTLPGGKQTMRFESVQAFFAQA